MTTWLERREAITRFEAYLDWINGTDLAQKDKGDVEEDVDEQEGQDSGEPDVEEEEEDGESTKFVYCIAKCPVFPQTPIDSLVNDFGAADFHLHLETFLRSRTDCPSKPLSPTLTQRTRFGVFKQAKLKLPAMSQVSRSSENNTIHASPGKPAQGIQPAKYGRFSSVMAQEFLNDGGHGRDDKNPLEGMSYAGICRLRAGTKFFTLWEIGLRVARVRAIFELPIEYAHLSNKPLTYVEWFTPFNVRDTDLGMYSITASTHSHRRRASILPLSQIVRTCYLIPHWSRAIDHTWTQDNVMEKYKKFYVNPYLRHSDFVIFCLLLDRWLKNNETL